MTGSMRWLALPVVVAAMAATASAITRADAHASASAKPRIDARAHASSGAQPASPTRTLESFDDVSAFTAVPSDGVSATLQRDSGVVGRALRMTFDYNGRAGYAVAKRAFTLPPLPAHWALSLWMRGDARANTLEIKLVDAGGQNVWWLRRPDLQVTRDWTRLRFRTTDLAFAWGPLGGGPPRDIASLEIVFTASQGGRGWIAVDEMALSPVAAPVALTVPPTLDASSSAVSRGASRAIDVDFAAPPDAALPAAGRGWRSGSDGAQSITMSFRGTRQLSGLVLDWSPTDWATDYDIEASDDGRAWTRVRSVQGSAGGRRYIHLPMLETSRLRVAMRRSSRGKGYELRDVRILSDSAASTRSAFLERVAQGSPAGLWPRPLTGQQSYWTVLGVPRDERDALFSEDGNVESRPGSFSIEPFLRIGERLVTWRDAIVSHELDGGWMPIPTSRRTTRDVALATTAFMGGGTNTSTLWVRYRVLNRTRRAMPVSLVAAIRPVQVNPPWQFLGAAGGAATVRSLVWRSGMFVVNDTDLVVPLTTPSRTVVSRFDAGSAIAPGAPVDTMSERRARRGTPAAATGATSVTDSTGFADGAMHWSLSLAPGDSADVWLALPDPASTRTASTRVDVPALVRSAGGPAALADTRLLWQRERDAFDLTLPLSASRYSRTIASSLAYILINARGPAIQPGTRSYRRSWIRDGALTSSALMRLGHANDARAFLDWFAPNVFPNGKTPCCVDARGADPVTENDADGELLYLAAEYVRMTGDSSIVREHWSTLSRVAAHLDSLRQSTRTARYRTPDSLLVFGLLPPSISHEGYSAKPAYSYWDDWWGVRGLDDAAFLARIAGDHLAGTRYAIAGREMRTDVVASVARSMQRFGLRTLPGAADLGDIDPTSSTMALEPAQALRDLPRNAVVATFDSAWVTLQRRLSPTTRWDVYTPYEWRDVGAFIRLDDPQRAHRYADWLFTTQRPAAWNQWSEAIWRDARAPKFVGDMPHGWVHSDFTRATLDMLAYERETDSVLVVGAGVPYAWAIDTTGVRLRGLHTWWGTLTMGVTARADVSMPPPAGGSLVAAAAAPRAASATRVAQIVTIVVRGVSPPGGVEVRAPFGRVPRSATVGGVAVALRTTPNGGRAVLTSGTSGETVVEFRY